MDAGQLLVLAAAGVAAGVVSVVVSLASLVSYPVLLALGLPPVAANVTNTVALVGTGIGATVGHRPELAGLGRLCVRLCVVGAAGGAAGAGLLLVLPATSFEAAVPVLVAAASVVILVQPAITARLAARSAAGARGVRPRVRRGLLAAALLAGCVYVGYFGAAGGVVLLAVLTPLLAGLPLVRVNAVKMVVAASANAVAAVGFVAFGPVDWGAAVPLGLGFLAGGWVGPAVARRIPAAAFRLLIGVSGLAVAAWLAVR